MEVEDYVGETVPSVEDLDDTNEGLLVECAILFVDIRGSTSLSDTSWAKSMAKIYRAFVRAMVMCVHKSGGSVRQIVGDRVMGVFVNQEETKATEKALDAARAIISIVDYYFNPQCNKKVNGKEIQCGVGIDYGKVLLTQVGIKAEDEEAKDLVWAGKIANVASKHTDLAEPGEIFITKRFYDNLPADKKSDIVAWESVVRLKGDTLFEGYVKENFYLDCILDEESSEEIGTTAEMKKESFSKDEGLNANEIINKIVQGTKMQTELLLQRFETVVKREVSIGEKEKNLLEREKAVRLKEQALSEQKKFLDIEKAKIEEKTKQRKIEVEYNLRAEHLSNNIETLKLEKMLEEMHSIIKLGQQLGKTHLDLKRNKLYYWRLVPYVKKFDVHVAYKLVEEYFINFPITDYGMPWESDIVDVVKRANRAKDFYELILYNLKKFSPSVNGLTPIRNVLKALGYNNGLEYFERKLLE